MTTDGERRVILPMGHNMVNYGAPVDQTEHLAGAEVVAMCGRARRAFARHSDRQRSQQGAHVCSTDMQKYESQECVSALERRLDREDFDAAVGGAAAFVVIAGEGIAFAAALGEQAPWLDGDLFEEEIAGDPRAFE